jgi:hypothetical protein
MKAKEIVFHLKNLKAGGTQSQNMNISDMEYLAMVDYYRATLIRQQQGAGYRINDRFIQDLGIIDIAPLYDNISTYATIVEIPSPIEVPLGVLIVDVVSTTGINYQKGNYSSVKWSKFSRLTKDEPKWFFVDNKVGVVNHVGSDKVRVKGIFESPYKALVFAKKHNELDPLDFEYPVTTTMLDTIYKMIIESEMKFLMLTHNDTLNNSSDENQG